MRKGRSAPCGWKTSSFPPPLIGVSIVHVVSGAITWWLEVVCNCSSSLPLSSQVVITARSLRSDHHLCASSSSFPPEHVFTCLRGFFGPHMEASGGRPHVYQLRICQDQSEVMNTVHGCSLFFPPSDSVFRRGAGVVVLLLEQAGLHSSCGEGSRL